MKPRQRLERGQSSTGRARGPGPGCQQPRLLTRSTAQQFPPSSQQQKDALKEPGPCGDQLILPRQKELTVQLSLSLSHS